MMANERDTAVREMRRKIGVDLNAPNRRLEGG